MGTAALRNIIFILLILVINTTSPASSQDVRIGLFENKLVNTFVFHCTEGQYILSSPEDSIRRIRRGELIYISLVDNMLAIHDGNKSYGPFNSSLFSEISLDSEFRIRLVDPANESLSYQGNLEVKVQNSAMQLINQLPLDNYLAGVVETEGGPSAPKEYYKAQTIICRTFALKHWNKHETQGFNLCDDTHCQSYKGINDDNKLIFEEVLATHNLVLIDTKNTLINASFHANSGGETQRASDIWVQGEDYLQSVIDNFSEGKRNSRWTKSILLSDWRKYILSKIAGDTSKMTNEALMIVQNHRRKYFIIGSDSLLIPDIRNDMGFRSSFFSMRIRNDSVIINGRGYGHGVGLSQEGAMEMARQKYSYEDILKFYYDMINISSIKNLPESEIPEIFREN